MRVGAGLCSVGLESTSVEIHGFSHSVPNKSPTRSLTLSDQRLLIYDLTT